MKKNKKYVATVVFEMEDGAYPVPADGKFKLSLADDIAEAVELHTPVTVLDVTVNY